MPHSARLWPESEIHLITVAGNARCNIFPDVVDRDLFLDLLDDVVVRFGWDLFAWCLLGNHLHFVVRAEAEALHRGMHRLKSVYAIRFHLRHHTSGVLFKRPYDSRPIVTEEQLLRSCGYTLRNPARHGFVQHAEDWEWSSFRSTAQLSPAPRRHLACEAFDRLLQLDAATNRLDVMRAFVRENDANPR